MARITVEDCLKRVPNMYDLVLLASKRVRQIQRGSDTQVKSKNRNIVVALREIAESKVRIDNIEVTQPEHPNGELSNLA